MGTSEMPRLLRPPVADALVAIGLAVLGALEVWLASDVNGWLGTVGVLGLTLPLAWRRDAPVLVCSGCLAAQTVVAHLGVRVDALVVVIPAVVLALYSLGLYAGRRRALLGLVVSLVLVLSSTFAAGGPGVDNAAFGVVVVVAPWSAGRLVRRRTEQAIGSALRAEQLERSQAERERSAIAEERARIARELHDIISHSVSVMTIQAGAIEEVIERDSQVALDAARSVSATGRDTLRDLRRLLGVLRDDPPAGIEFELGPQPGLRDLPTLVHQIRGAGLDVTLDFTDGLPQVIPAGVDLCVFRVVQEALTNTLKHGQASRAWVRIGREDHALAVEVLDDGAGPADGPSHTVGGHGLVGMRERAALYGGSFEYGAGPRGGFRIRVAFPLQAEPSA